ncbi:flagellar hook-basal body complex protein FliE [Pengzhenrongella phosphoraccumulans]|uniref:flagellar hook-basal body complex protein FliE n=1 Tax=Pengzhenrongella phosphoraccumulans TaxID=3114394 RepID=UPI003890D210
MNIAALGAISGVTGTGYAGAADAVGGAQTSGGVAFGNVAASIDSLQGLQSTSDALAVKAVTGDLDNVHDYTIAASEAKVTLELTAAIRNKAVEAFSEIMRMQA